MSDDGPAPIPVPVAQRWRDARIRLVPAVVFGAVLVGTLLLWKDHVAAPMLVGQAEPVLENVSCHKPGVLAELYVNRFQRVRLGEPIARVMIVDPRYLAASLDVISARIEALRASRRPVVYQEHAAMDYIGLVLRRDAQEARLDAAQARLDYAEFDLNLQEKLFKDKIVAQIVYEKAKAQRDRYRNQVNQLSNLVEEAERSIQNLQTGRPEDLNAVSTNSLQAAIAVEEAELRRTEAELNPVTVKAPMNGIVSTIYHRAGESITPGQPIVTVATADPVRIVGYLRAPLLRHPTNGTPVVVRTRGANRRAAAARITEVGTQMEVIPPTLLGPLSYANTVQGLPLDISLPPGLSIRAGELVDITFDTRTTPR
jgi:multidrug resistance efflux pump